MLLRLQLARRVAVVTQESLSSSQKFFTWGPYRKRRCKEHGCLPAAGMQEMGWSRLWAPALAHHVASATGNPCFYTASDAVFTGIKKSQCNLAQKGGELDGIHCKAEHRAFIIASFVVACSRFEMQASICGAGCWCLQTLWQVTFCHRSWALLSNLPTLLSCHSHVLKQGGVQLSI